MINSEELKTFEVKSGENKGVYLAIPNDYSKEEQVKFMREHFGPSVGHIPIEQKPYFYQRHSMINHRIWRADIWYGNQRFQEKINEILNH